MYAGKLVFAQVMECAPWHAFRRLATKCHGDFNVRSFSCQGPPRKTNQRLAFGQTVFVSDNRGPCKQLVSKSGMRAHSPFGRGPDSLGPNGRLGDRSLRSARARRHRSRFQLPPARPLP